MMTATSSASTTSFTIPAEDTAVRRKQVGRQPDHYEHTNLSDATRPNLEAHFQVPTGRCNKWETALRVQPMMLVVTAALIRCGAASSLYKNVPFAA